MPYGYVLLAATVVIAIRHVRSSYASNVSKALVAGFAAFSVSGPFAWPRFLPGDPFVPLFCLFLQFAVCFYVIIHRAAWRPDDERAEGLKVDEKVTRKTCQDP
jgi:hypothetical protein